MLDTMYMQVLDMSKTASIVILAVLLARLLLKKAPKVFSYALWGVVLFRLLCPFSMEAPVSVVPEMTSVSQGYTLSEEPISVLGASEAAYRAVGDALNGGLGVQHIRTTETDETGMTRYVTTDWWSVWILFGQYVWAAGIAVMLLYSAVSYLKIRRQLLVVVPLRDNIFIADDIKSPFVIGLFRPKIYLPCNLDEKEQAYIILHERYHIKRFDYIIKALAFLALTIHWFNPLVWLAFVLAGKDMEMSCDEAVIRRLGSDVRADYSASLLTLATGRRIIAGTPLAFGEGDTRGRINHLAKWKKPAVWVVVTAAAACAVIAVCLMTDPSNHHPLVGAEYEITDTVYSHDMTYEENFTPADSYRVTADLHLFELRGHDSWIDLGVLEAYPLTNRELNSYHQGGSHRSYSLKTIREAYILRVEGDCFYLVFQTKDGKNYLAYGWEDLSERGQVGSDDTGLRRLYLLTRTANATSSVFTGELIPGTTYVSYQCLYMNPLSSYAAMGGDSGCKYVVGEDYFATIYRGNSISINATDPDADAAQHRIKVSKWKWQKFPYSDEEWAELYRPKGMWSIENISEQYSEMLYQPLTSDKFLLKMDASLWLVDISNDPKVGTYIWSIYSLVPESVMGAAQWEYAPLLSSRIPVFPFDFDLAHTEVFAYCSNGSLGTYGVDSGSSLTIQNGETLYWSPVGEDGTVVKSAIIDFSVRDGETPTYNGTIYIEGSTGSDGRTNYTATIVGTGLRLEQSDGQQGGGVVSTQIPGAN